MTAMAPPRLQVEPSLDFSLWTPHDDLALLDGERHATNVLELERIGDRRATRGLRIRGPIARGVLEHGDAVALVGGEALVDWVLRDARAPSVRVLAFDADVDTSRLASAPFLAQVRRLILRGASAIASPWLGPLQALRRIGPTSAMPMPPRLRELRIAGTASAGTLDATLALLRVTHLERLELSALEVPLDALAHATLRELTLTDCVLRGAELLAAMPALEIFAARRCGLDDEAALALADAAALTTLSLAENAITDAGVAALAALPSLRELDLSHTQVTDAGVASLAALRSLRSLSLANTAITDAGVATLAELSPHLHAVDVANTAVSEAGAAALEKRRIATRLELRGTPAG